MSQKLFSILLCAFLIIGCSNDNKAPLNTVSYVDLQKYMGTWYEIASFPTWFQKGCTGTTATYTLNTDNTVTVLNKCFKPDSKGILTPSTAEGTAYVADPITNAKLKVSFFWPFSGDYWIIELASDYSYAVVGHPNREYLWILSRSPYMNPETYADLLERIKIKGFDIRRLNKTVQPVK